MKLFWSNTFTNQWYHCPDYWLFEHRTLTYVLPRHCLEFASKITNIEIDMTRLELRFIEDGEDCDEENRASTVAKAKVFWAKVEKVFPSVERIVLTGCTPRRPSPPLPGTYDEEYACIETVLNLAPVDVVVHVAFVAFPNLERGKPPRNTLWQVQKDSQPVWRALDPDWRPIRVLLPNRRWSVSPLGDFQTFYWKLRSAMIEIRGIQWLMIESYARYAVENIQCPRLDCPLTFNERGIWKRHLLDSGHDRFEIRAQSREVPMLQLFCCKHTPEMERLAIEARQQRLDKQYLEAAKIQRRVGYGWGPPNSEQRRLFEQEFIAQMQGESLYEPEKPIRGIMSPDQEILDSLCMWFDRRHVYHGCSSEEGHICYGE